LFPTIRASAVFIACAGMFALAPPAVADPADPIPGNGFFRVGPDISAGLHHTGGTASSETWFLRATDQILLIGITEITELIWDAPPEPR
jgi:hypothetical protein